MMITHHFCRLVAVKYIYDVFRTVFLVYLLDGLQRNLQQLACVHHLIGLPAVVAVTAFVLVVLLAEIVQQQFSAAYGTLRITLRLKQQLVTNTNLFRSLVFLETAQTLDVVRAVETDTLSFAAVTTGTTCLLIITFQALRDVVMHHEPHIRLVDTHTECNRRNNHLTLFHQECILVRTTCCRIHSGMVRSGADAVHLQHLGEIFHLLACQTIYNTAFAFHAADETNKVFVHICCLRAYFVIQVRTVETALENSCVWHSEVLLNIFLHFRRSRGGQCDNRRFADTLHHRAYLTVLRTEVMTPLRDTMGLIYGVERNLYALQEIYVLCFLQTLRG